MTIHPKLFISYSWTSHVHEEWVLSLAKELCENGVNVILDKWDLKEGYDAHAFMERMVTDTEIKKVAMICDHIYAEKANGRSGGVGTETQILSAEIYAREDQTKFVAILPERNEDGLAFLPAYYKSRVYIDLSDPDLYSKNFEQLLRWIYDKPLHVKPDLGDQPSFLSGDTIISLKTSTQFRRAITAIRECKPNSISLLRDYLEVFTRNLDCFRIAKNDTEFDEQVIKSIEDFIPYRNEATDVFRTLARYKATQESWEALHRFFEELLPYYFRPGNVTSGDIRDCDNFKFIIHELFLYAIANLLKYECFSGVAHLLRQYYYSDENVSHGNNALVPFSEFQAHLKSLDYRNERLNLNQLSLRASLLEKRSRTLELPFKQLMQADFVLFLRDSFDCLRTGRHQRWCPITLVYSDRQYGPFEIFSRGQSTTYFDNLKQIFDIDSKDNFVTLENAFRQQKLTVPSWGRHHINLFGLMKHELLACIQ